MSKAESIDAGDPLRFHTLYVQAVAERDALRTRNAELLAALKQAVSCEHARCKGWAIPETDWMHDARAAIEKAEGK